MEILIGLVFLVIIIIATIRGLVTADNKATDSRSSYKEPKNILGGPYVPHRIQSAGRFPIKGLYYRDYEAKDYARSLQAGDELFFQIEHYNSYDRYAVRVENAEGIHFGYVPSSYSQVIFEDLDAGLKYNVIVDGLEYPRDNIPEVWLRVSRISDKNTEVKLIEKDQKKKNWIESLNIPPSAESQEEWVSSVLARNIKELSDGAYRVEECLLTKSGGIKSITYTYIRGDEHKERLFNAQKLEAEGNIEEAIKEYEELTELCFSSLPFERLCIIFRKKKMYDDEVRIIEDWLRYEKSNITPFPKKGIAIVELRYAKAIALKERNQ